MQENRFHLAGYLAARPTLRSLPSGMAVANVRLGQTYRLSRNGLPAEHTNWFSLVFYGDLATLATSTRGPYPPDAVIASPTRAPASRRTTPGWATAPWTSTTSCAAELCEWPSLG